MFDGILTKIFGSRNNRLVKAYRRRVAQINKLEPELIFSKAILNEV